MSSIILATSGRPHQDTLPHEQHGSRAQNRAVSCWKFGLIKPLMHEAMDRTLTADDREHRMLAILSDWVPFEDYDTDDEGSPDA